MIPVSTSPVPPVAMPGLPVVLCASCRPSVTSVWCPLSTITTPHSAASSTACRSCSSRGTMCFACTSRANSPGWGVSTRGPAVLRKTFGLRPPRHSSASASKTAGCVSVVKSQVTSSSSSADRDRPGPHPTAVAFLVNSEAKFVARYAAGNPPVGVAGQRSRHERRLERGDRIEAAICDCQANQSRAAA